MSMVDDLDTFNVYSWGREVFETKIHSLHQRIYFPSTNSSCRSHQRSKIIGLRRSTHCTSFLLHSRLVFNVLSLGLFIIMVLLSTSVDWNELFINVDVGIQGKPVLGIN